MLKFLRLTVLFTCYYGCWRDLPKADYCKFEFCSVVEMSSLLALSWCLKVSEYGLAADYGAARLEFINLIV